jgi:hypothetical protein
LSIEHYQALSKKPQQLHGWRGISVVVMEENEDNTMLRVKRVLPEDDYKTKFSGEVLNIREQPTVIKIQGKSFVLMEESFFFYCNQKEDEPALKRRKIEATEVEA